ncbi:MAG: peroxiredoxin, partial [Bdellovibrionales bacterium]|nr:peroxiredoxin [Bdellovibrionales bacterium]
NTPGCTIEAKSFSKEQKKFKDLGVTLIGISGGDEKSKTKFCEKHKLKTLMLSDTDFKVADKYGVYGEKQFMGKTFMGISRVTYVLDANKKVIKRFDKVKPETHPKEVLAYLKELL